MIDNLGFHVDRDYQAELDRLQRQIKAVTTKVTGGGFYSYEDRHNTYAQLENLERRARTLITDVAMERQRLDRLTAAIRTAGDPELAFIAYVVFGPAALPLEPMYEARLVDEYGHTVPGCVRTNLPFGRVERVKSQLMKVDGPAYAREMALRFVGYRVQVTPF